MARCLRCIATLLLFVFVVAGCEMIAGIEDRRLADDAGADASNGPPVTALCRRYCDDVMASCTGEFAVYSSMDVCLSVCSRLPEGDVDEAGGNTVACRAKYAEFARSGEPNVNCSRAGPGGNGTCGENCESYCMLFADACPDDAVDDCERKCRGLPDDGTFDVVKHHDGDYMQCRLVHTSTAIRNPEAHCWHATITPGPDSPCGPLESQPVLCEEYCDLVAAACMDQNAVYENREQCLAVCEVLDFGTILDKVEDTVGCRRYHSYNSMEDPEIHCPHASPGGDGHCGETNCPAYCKIAAEACAEEFATEFGSQAACTSACANLEGAEADSGYSVETATGNNLQCRILNASRALSDPSRCAAAFGGGECQ